MAVLAKPVPFGKYYLLEKINTGGMAEVFKAKSFGVEGFERIVAVKKILPDIAEDSEFITMFIDEAKIASQLTHANIAQTFDLGNIDGQYYIAMEYISGRDLRVIFDRCARSGQKLDIACVCYIVSEICKGLDYAHNKKDTNGESLGVIHRDISPQNILISYEGDCKLIDFGIAKAANKTNSTQVGILKGKFSYMSPEQVQGKVIDSRSDIFALGIVLFEMLTLKRLFLGSSDFSTLEKIRKVEVSPPTLYNPDIPEDLEDIVLKALEKDVALRYQSAEELGQALQKFMMSHDMFYTSKNLSEFMHTVFSKEIVFEQKKHDCYRGLTKEKLEREAALASANAVDAAEDETSFYEKNAAGRAGMVSAEQVSIQPAQKQAIYAELDGFVPPSNDIIYSSKNAGKSSGFSAVKLSNTPSVDGLGLSKDESLSDLASKPISLGGAMPAPRRSMSSMAPVVTTPAKEKETVAAGAALPGAPKSSNASFMRTVFFSVVAMLIVVVIILGYIFVSKKWDPNDCRVSFIVYPENVPISIEVNGKMLEYAEPLLSGKIALENFSCRLETEYRITSDNYEESTGKILATSDGAVVPVSMNAKSGYLPIYVNQPGAVVKLDGKIIDGDMDFAISDINPGDHVIEITKERYKTISEVITVARGTNEKKIFMMYPRFGSLKLISDPDGGEFKIRNKETGDIQRVQSGSIVDELIVGNTYEISYRDNGKEITRSWSPREDGALDTRTYSMRPDPASEAGSAVADGARRPSSGSSASANVGSAKKETKTDDGPKADAAPKKAAPAPAQEAAPSANVPGIFKINSKPPCEIYINGKHYGTAPKNVDLPAGTYTIRFVNSEQGIDFERTEKLQGGSEVKVIQKF